jgi:hypothetical protein
MIMKNAEETREPFQVEVVLYYGAYVSGQARHGDSPPFPRLAGSVTGFVPTVNPASG